MQRVINLTITIENNQKRFDKAVASLLPELSRSCIQKSIRSGHLKLNNQETIPKHKVYLGDKITGTIIEQNKIKYQPQAIPINIIYQDEHIIVINKPAGLVVHPGAGNIDGTLLNAVLYHFPELQSIPRAGIVHRLDKDTSGIMVIARTLESQFNLVKQLQARTVKRCYIALAIGEFIASGKICANIGRCKNNRIKMAVSDGGKVAITHYNILKRYTGLTLLKCKLETGRTHQIRVHMAHINHPLVGDPVYGRHKRLTKKMDTKTKELILSFPRQALHATELEFIHPDSNEIMCFKVNIAGDMKGLISHL